MGAEGEGRGLMQAPGLLLSGRELTTSPPPGPRPRRSPPGSAVRKAGKLKFAKVKKVLTKFNFPLL